MNTLTHIPTRKASRKMINVIVNRVIAQTYRKAQLKLPVRGKAVWKLKEGDLEYIDVTVTELEYNVGGAR